MKKRVLALVCAMTLMLGSTVTVFAKDPIISPSGVPDNTETTDKAETAPKTGEGNLLLYGIAGALVLAGTAVVSRKQLENA
ncbi:MAG: LPXTG cell wall anchor domain-containing protein [Ruminococcus sp.]|nr:LPXTG cell wall anchor domain-containing protein [Ruminococcus sp.]